MKYFLHAVFACTVGGLVLCWAVAGYWVIASFGFLFVWFLTWADFRDDTPPPNAPIDEQYTETPWDKKL